MRYQGRITTWKDEQGFGFITPNGGGERVFLHIKAFAHPGRRPAGDELVTYELAFDERKRTRAERVAYVGRSAVDDEPQRRRDRAPARTTARKAWVAVMVVVGFFGALLGAIALRPVFVAVLGVYFVASIVSLFAYGFDKWAAERDRWRKSEASLHLIDLLCGWPGGMLAQSIFRHKLTKASFQRGFQLTVLVNVVGLAVFLARLLHLV